MPKTKSEEAKIDFSGNPLFSGKFPSLIYIYIYIYIEREREREREGERGGRERKSKSGRGRGEVERQDGQVMRGKNNRRTT